MPADFTKSAPNLDKSKPPLSSLSPLPQRRILPGVGRQSATSLGKSHDEGLNRVKGKRQYTSQYNRGHTTNLCGGISSNSNPLTRLLGDSAEINPGSGSNRAQEQSPIGNGGGGLRRPPEKGSISQLDGTAVPRYQHHKKFSLDNTASGTADVTYDKAFYRKMKQSLDDLFEGRRYKQHSNKMLNSRSSGDLLNSDESADEAHGSSEFKRECFLNSSAPGYATSSATVIISPRRSGSDKFQYLSLNNLPGATTTTTNRGDLRGEEIVASRDQSVNSAQFSHSSTSSNTTTSTSSRKNSQVSFEEPRAGGSAMKLPPSKSEVSPRKFDKIYNMGTTNASHLFGSVKEPPKKEKTNFVKKFFYKGSKSGGDQKTGGGKRGVVKDEKINLVLDDSNELGVEDGHGTTRVDGVDGSFYGSRNTYDMIYTKTHIIAKQSADHSMFRSDSQ